MLVIDASTTLSWCLDGEAPNHEALARVVERGAQAPAIWPFEIGNVLWQAQRRGKATAEQVQNKLGWLASLGIAVDTANISALWGNTLQLAQAHQLTLYDASYLELALRLKADLATNDTQLAAAAKAERLIVL